MRKHNKSIKDEQMIIESGIKSIEQLEEIKRISSELQDANEKLKQSYRESVETLRYIVEAKDSYTKGHSDRVAEYSVLIGKKLGLDEKSLRTLRVGGLFHDIGKIGIPDSILLKSTSLTNDEYSKIQHHPSIGVNILSNSTIFSDIIPIVKYHHERYDGRGYPENLKGEEIPLLARITSIADSFDAMSSMRTYRDNLEQQHIIDEIENNKNTQFDPSISDAFLDIIRNNYDAIEEIQSKYKSTN